jgi:hypothetical protein
VGHVAVNLRRPAGNSCYSNFQSIFTMNLFFGWTIAGWVVVLFRAISCPPEGEGGTFKVTPFGAVPPNKTGDQPHAN